MEYFLSEQEEHTIKQYCDRSELSSPMLTMCVRNDDGYGSGSLPVSVTNELSLSTRPSRLGHRKARTFLSLQFLFVLNYIAVSDTASSTSRSYIGSASKRYPSLNSSFPCGHFSCSPDVALIGSFHVSLDVKFHSIPLDIKASFTAFSLPYLPKHHLSPIWRS